jgi:hypothetical protein
MTKLLIYIFIYIYYPPLKSYNNLNGNFIDTL